MLPSCLAAAAYMPCDAIAVADLINEEGLKKSDQPTDILTGESREAEEQEPDWEEIINEFENEGTEQEVPGSCSGSQEGCRLFPRARERDGTLY